MPLYEYKCERCGVVFEVLQRFSDQRLKVHKGCGGSVDRLVSAPSFKFKGSGFYITDYSKGSNGKPAGKKKDEGPAPAAKSEPPATKSSSDSSAPAKS
jgi:putative FmdB family regulatory protein